MNESTQIVRRLQRGEFIPAYSTDELMRGVCHVVALKIPTAKPEMPSRQPNIAKNQIDPAAVARMLSQNKSNRMIAWRTGVGMPELSLCISNNKKLRDLSVARKGCAVSVSDRNFDVIKNMLMDGKSGDDIGVSIGLSGSKVRYYINSVDELRKIYADRNRINGPARASKEKFIQKRSAIYRALKMQSITAVSDSFGFRTDVLRRHLTEEVKNGK